MEGIRIFCENTSSYEKVSIGTTLSELYVRMNQNKPMLDEPVLAALVDNKLKSLDYKIINPHNVRFIDYGHPDGRRTYIRSLCFVLQKVVREMFPEKVLVIDYSLHCFVLQYLYHFENHFDFVLYLVDKDGYETVTLKDILPHSFSPKKHMGQG